MSEMCFRCQKVYGSNYICYHCTKELEAERETQEKRMGELEALAKVAQATLDQFDAALAGTEPMWNMEGLRIALKRLSSKEGMPKITCGHCGEYYGDCKCATPAWGGPVSNKTGQLITNWKRIADPPSNKECTCGLFRGNIHGKDCALMQPESDQR